MTLPEREQLELARALIDDAMFEIMVAYPRLALRLGAEELREHVRIVDQSLGQLAEIIKRRLEGADEVHDASKWAELVVKVQSGLRQARELGGDIGGVALTRVPEHLPRQLPTTQPASTKEAQSPLAQNSGKKPQGVEKKPLAWQDIEITFLSDHRVEICRGDGNRENYNYSELGFEDRRSGIPNRAWITLREMAGKGGTIPQAPAGNGRCYRSALRKFGRSSEATSELTPIPSLLTATRTRQVSR